MEIDALKPKTVPLAAETVLWFEFLLKPELLIEHLKKKQPEPSPVELIEKFMTINTENAQPEFHLNAKTNTWEPFNPDKPYDEKLGRKQIALKILAINVTSHLRWDLNVIERNWNLQKQIQLIQDLCIITSGKGITIPMREQPTISALGNTLAFEFALFVYHRWILRVYKHLKDLIVKKKAVEQNPVGVVEPNIPLRDEISMLMIPEPQISVDYLTSFCTGGDQKRMPILSSASVLPLTTSSEPSGKGFRFEKNISTAEKKAQIYFDLCQYFLYNNFNEQAKEYAILCQQNFLEMQTEYKLKGIAEYLICDFSQEELNGVLLACGASSVPDSLMQRFNNFVMNRGDNLMEILKADNVARDIPFVQRKIIELDMEATSSVLQGNTTNVPKSIVALNTIRSVVAPESILLGSDFLGAHQTDEDYSFFINHLAQYLQINANEVEKQRLKDYVMNSITAKEVISPVLENICRGTGLITEEDISSLRKLKSFSVTLPGIATSSEWSMSETNRQRVERNLISSTNPATFKQLLVEFVTADSTVPLWRVNPAWSIPDQLKSVLVSLTRGFIQDYSYLILGKAKEAISKKDFPSAINMLTMLRTEMQRSEYTYNKLIGKLNVLVSWEILLVQIQQALHEFPRKVGDPVALAGRCSHCLLATSQNVDGVSPRTQVLEYCGYYLLNSNDLNSSMAFEKRNPILQLCTELGTVISELEAYRTGARKSTVPQVWILITQMFETGPKRSNPIPTTFLPMVNHIRDGMAFAVLISLLAKIHNIIKDEINSEIGSEFIFLWPTTLSGQLATPASSNSSQPIYNIRLVAEVLGVVLQQALKYHPQNVGFLKQMGDLELSNGNNETAMRYYVSTVVAASENCTLHLGRPIIDDVLLRRMIKCCSNMGCHVQAAVLHQFMDEIDYSTAFKCLSEKSSIQFTDAMDAYYPCIWDITLLEFIVNMHSRKGEHVRKQQAIAYMSQLELNTNNNEEIKREAAAIRKAHFIRALAKQYLVC